VTKRNKIIERARSLLSSMVEESKTSGSDLLDEVRQSVQVSEIVSFGAERLPAGPNVTDSDAIIIVEGRQDVLNLQLGGSSTARLLDDGDSVVTEVPVRELVDTLKTAKQTRAIVFDGIITQRILDIASEMNMHSVVGTKMGTITKQPAGVEVWTRSDLVP